MKETPKETDLVEIMFNFDTSEEQELKQIEFLYSYYIAKLRIIRRESPFEYITKEQASKEALYKDLIAACACYLHELKFKPKKNERDNQKSGDLP
jgi:hypothetical protein